GLFPALGVGWIHLDGAAGMLVRDQVGQGVSTAMRAPGSAPAGGFPESQRAACIVAAARHAVEDAAGSDPGAVVLGPNAPAVLSRLADTLADTWTLGDEVVVSRLDEPANTDPWLRAMKRIGGNVRWSEIDIETCESPAWQYEQLVGSRTKAVSVTAASGSVGTRPDVSTIAEIAKKV